MPENKTFIEKFRSILDKMGTMALMNFMYLIACLPILTIGPAWNGLLTAIRFHIRGDKWFDGFKFGYKTRFLRSFVLWNAMLLPILFFLTEINYHWENEQFVPLLVSFFSFLLLAMFLAAMQMLNVYVPTRFNRWIHDAIDMMKSANWRLILLAALFWTPLFLLLMAPAIFFLIAIIFVAAYYTLGGMGMTLLLKDSLVDRLVDARADKELLAEEGKPQDE